MRHALIIPLLICVVFAVGCEPKNKNKEFLEVNTPAPRYTGPEFLNGTISSIASLRGYRPILVSGYGLVVNLDKTGSNDCPTFLRQRMIDRISKMGFGVSSTGFGNMTPQEVLESNRTSVVKVEGIIEPGSLKGSRFDLLVSTLPASQTTSLEGGVLYTTDLAVNGTDFDTPPSVAAVARGRGPLMINPFRETDGKQQLDDLRIARVPAGGVTLENAPLVLDVRRPSYRLSADIASRVNTRFAPTRFDRTVIANAVSPALIELTIPRRFENNPQRLLDLVSHLYLNPTNQFSEQKARELLTMIEQPNGEKFAEDVAYIWEGFGKPLLPFYRQLYKHDLPHVKFAALSAGVHLSDALVVDPLFEIIEQENSKGPRAERALKLLAVHLRNYPDDVRTVTRMRPLLDADDTLIRIATVGALVDIRHPSVLRMTVSEKFELNVVQCDGSMIYVTRSGKPRIVVFTPEAGLKKPVLARLFDGRFMIDTNSESDRMKVFYRQADLATGTTRPNIQEIPNSISSLVILMGYRPTKSSDPTPGYDMTYADILTVLHRLNEQKFLNAPLVVQSAATDARIRKLRETPNVDTRPETDKPQSDNDIENKEEKNGLFEGLFE